MSHTPGPWMISEGATGYGHVRDDHCRSICAYGNAKLSQEESQANACLIVAAPDLLAALKAVRPIVANFGDGPEDQAKYDFLCDAIAKAEGRT